MKCVNCSFEIHLSYVDRYDGYCLNCWNAGVPALREEITILKDDLRNLFDWYDRDGSVGGADIVFEQVRKPK